MATGLYLGLLVIGVALFVLYARTGRMLRCILFTAGTGLAALGVLWLVGRAMSIPMGITPFSMLVSALLGIPGVLGMLVLNLL